MIGLAGPREAVVHGLASGYEVVRPDKFAPCFGERPKFARAGFGSFERPPTGDTLANEIFEVAIGHLLLAAVSILGKVVPGNDTKLAQLDDRRDFRFAQDVGRTLSRQERTTTLKPHLDGSIPRETSWGLRGPARCRGSLARISLPRLAIDRSQVGEIAEGMLEILW